MSVLIVFYVCQNKLIGVIIHDVCAAMDPCDSKGERKQDEWPISFNDKSKYR